MKLSNAVKRYIDSRLKPDMSESDIFFLFDSVFSNYSVVATEVIEYFKMRLEERPPEVANV